MNRENITTDEAKKQIAFNCLYLNCRGLESFPGKIVLIDSMPVENMEDGCKAIELGVKIYGYMDEDDRGEYSCRSFFVKLNHNYWHRDWLGECLYLIECLRHLNDYKPENR
jgi:hypothetical protein